MTTHTRIEFDETRARSYRKRTAVLAFESRDAFAFDKPGGRQTLEAGSWILVALDTDDRPTGDVYGCAPREFHDTYAPDGGPHRYVKVTPVLAYQPGLAFEVRTVLRDGHVEVRENRGGAVDWAVRNVGGEVYAIADDAFRRMYAPEPDAGDPDQ